MSVWRPIQIDQAGLRLSSPTMADGPFLRDLLLNKAKNPQVLKWWDDSDASDVARKLADTAQDFYVLIIHLQDQPIGLIQFEVEPDPKYRHVSIDMAIADNFQGRGLAPRAITALVAWLVAKGHHRFMIDPNVGNLPAIKAYAKAGFKKVGIVPKAEFRDETGQWEDLMLMALVWD